MTRHDQIHELVGDLARVRDEDLASASDSKAAMALFEEVVSMPHPRTDGIPATRVPARSRRHRGRTVALLTAAVVALGAVATFAASQWLSPQEQLSAVDRLGQDIPLPPGGSFDAVRAGISRDPAQQEEAGLAGALAFAATCQWYGYWLDADNRGDRTQMSAALKAIDGIPSWAELAQVGSGPGGTVEYLKELAQTTHNGNADPVRQFLTANCGAEPWADSVNG